MLLNCGVGKTLQSPLDCKGIQPVHPKGNQSWIFIGRTGAEAETPILWPPDGKEPTHWKRPWCWERLKAGEGDHRGWDGWMASPSQWTRVWESSKTVMDRESWHAIVHGIIKSQTRPSNWTTTTKLIFLLIRSLIYSLSSPIGTQTLSEQGHCVPRTWSDTWFL